MAIPEIVYLHQSMYTLGLEVTEAPEGAGFSSDDSIEYIRKDIADKAVKEVKVASVRVGHDSYKQGYEDARIEVREECAKIAESMLDSINGKSCGDPDYNEACTEIAKAIRGND